MVTIKDVARLAQVSVTTASYALNSTGNISQETRKRVLDAAERLNYHPIAFARKLKRQRTHTIGAFITEFGGSFYEDILEGIHRAVLQTDYELIVCPHSRSVRKLFIQRQVDGAIVFDSKVESDLIMQIASRNFPVVVLDRNLQADYLLPLLVDNTHGAREVFSHFYKQGARRVAFVSGAPDSFDNTERMQAFLSAGEEAGLFIHSYPGNFTEQSGYQAAQQILESGSLPEAVFCANDQMAIGFINAMHEKGLNIPEHIAVAGFDDIQIARYMQPSLSTVAVSRFLWGASAATQLMGFLENHQPFEPQRIPTEFMARQSSLFQRS